MRCLQYICHSLTHSLTHPEPSPVSRVLSRPVAVPEPRLGLVLFCSRLEAERGRERGDGTGAGGRAGENGSSGDDDGGGKKGPGSATHHPGLWLVRRRTRTRRAEGGGGGKRCGGGRSNVYPVPSVLDRAFLFGKYCQLRRPLAVAWQLASRGRAPLLAPSRPLVFAVAPRALISTPFSLIQNSLQRTLGTCSGQLGARCIVSY